MIRSLTAVRVTIFLGAENGEALGLHRDLEGRDLLGLACFAVGDEPKRVAVEGVRRVFRRGDDQETRQVPARTRER